MCTFQTNIIRKSDLEYWRKKFKGKTALDIANRVISRFRVELDSDGESDDDYDSRVDKIRKGLEDYESEDEAEPPMSADHESECDEDDENLPDLVGSASGGAGGIVSTTPAQHERIQCQPIATADLMQRVTARSSCLPDTVNYLYQDILPPNWPDPRADCYQEFFNAYFTGKVKDASGHDWSKELQMSLTVQTSRPKGTSCAMTVWQAAGYLHARKVVEVPSIKGCLYYWTPGSGKSIMIALLLDVLYRTDYQVYVVSSPQNIRQNDLECCAKSLLKFSPIFNLGGREPTADDVKEMRRMLRKRPNGPAILVKNFMTFKQFGRFCVENGPEKVLEKAALIIDESHLLFDEKKCDKDIMWGTVLETITKCTDSKVFTFSGTPGKNRTELLLQLEIVRHASQRIKHSSLLEESEGFQARLGDYAGGLVSYVDGTKDLSRYPINCGVDKVVVEMSQPQLYNFSKRCQMQLDAFGAEDFEVLLASIRDGSGPHWKDAVKRARLTQTAGTVFWGGSRAGLYSVLQLNKNQGSALAAEFQPDSQAAQGPSAEVTPGSTPGPTPEILIGYSPKFKKIVDCVRNPPGTEPLETKHFIYSSNQSTITSFAQTLQRLYDPVQQVPFKLFKQLCAQDFQWSSNEETELALVNPLTLDNPLQILFVVLGGTVDDKKKLKTAFGQITPDGARYEGLRRADGSPLIQAILGTHETNQGLTFLRLQHIHLIEPNPKGWSEASNVLLVVMLLVGFGLRALGAEATDSDGL